MKRASPSYFISILNHSKTLPNPMHFNASLSSLSSYPENMYHTSQQSAFSRFCLHLPHLFIHSGQLGNMAIKRVMVAVCIELMSGRQADCNQTSSKSRIHLAFHDLTKITVCLGGFKIGRLLPGPCYKEAKNSLIDPKVFLVPQSAG